MGYGNRAMVTTQMRFTDVNRRQRACTLAGGCAHWSRSLVAGGGTLRCPSNKPEGGNIMEATISIKLTDQEADDILRTALAGGITYWADVIAFGRNDGVLMAHIRPIEGDDFEPMLIHTGHIQQGVDRICEKYSARGHYCQDLLNDNVDAETADVVVQFALFGKIIYG